MLNTTPATWVAGAVLTAAQLNTQLRDALTDLQAAWTAYTTSWGATTAPAIGNGTLEAAYTRIGKTVLFRISLTAGSTTTFGTGLWTFTLPVAPVAGRWPFTVLMRDSSLSDIYAAQADRTSGSTIAVRCDATTAGNPLRSVTGTVPFAWATGDELTILGSYEAA